MGKAERFLVILLKPVWHLVIANPVKILPCICVCYFPQSPSDTLCHTPCPGVRICAILFFSFSLILHQMYHALWISIVFTPLGHSPNTTFLHGLKISTVSCHELCFLQILLSAGVPAPSASGHKPLPFGVLPAGPWILCCLRPDASHFRMCNFWLSSREPTL